MTTVRCLYLLLNFDEDIDDSYIVYRDKIADSPVDFNELYSFSLDADRSGRLELRYSGLATINNCYVAHWPHPAFTHVARSPLRSIVPSTVRLSVWFNSLISPLKTSASNCPFVIATL